MRLSDRNLSFKDLIKDGLSAKWKIYHLLLSIILTPYYRFVFLIKGIKWGKKWRLFGLPLIHKYKGSTIQIGDRFTSRGWFFSNPIGVINRTFLTTLNPNAKIIIGNNVGISGAVISASEEIVISDNTLIGANTRIFDNDFHSINYKNRGDAGEEIKAKKVFIGKNVLIGANCIIMKGISIGDNSIIGAGSIVSCDVSSDSIYAGNPARFIKKINI